MPIPQLDFIGKELAGSGARTSRHRFGCRILCRLFEHAAGDKSFEPLIDEILAEAGPLSRHIFGHHVIHTLLEHGLASALLSSSVGVRALAQNQYGCYVVKALLRIPGDLGLIAHDQLRCAAADLLECKYGRRLLKDLGILEASTDQ